MFPGELETLGGCRKAKWQDFASRGMSAIYSRHVGSMKIVKKKTPPSNPLLSLYISLDAEGGQFGNGWRGGGGSKEEKGKAWGARKQLSLDRAVSGVRHIDFISLASRVFEFHLCQEEVRGETRVRSNQLELVVTVDTIWSRTELQFSSNLLHKFKLSQCFLSSFTLTKRYQSLMKREISHKNGFKILQLLFVFINNILRNESRIKISLQKRI